MPCVSVTLTDIEQSVARPSIFMILNQIFEITQLSKDTVIRYAGKRSFMHTPGTTIDDESQRDAQFASKRYTFIDVIEEYVLSAVQETQPHGYDKIPVFNDPALQLSLRPIYLTSEVTISIRYRSNSESEVKRWMAEMMIRTARGRDVCLHDISYTYALPDAFTGLVCDVWALRNAVAPYGDSPEEYMTRYGTNRLTILTNRAGKHALLAVSETQTQIQGAFDFVGVPDAPTRDEATGTWEIAFNYKFNYQRPESIVAYYPVSVHNQLLPSKYLDYAIGDMDMFEKVVSRDKSYEALLSFDLNTYARATRQPNPYLRLPDFDDFRPQRAPVGTATAITALCFLGDDQVTLMNLRDLGDYTLDKTLIPYLVKEAPYLTKLYHSLIHVELYKDGVMVPDGTITVTSNLDVVATSPLDLRKVYHIRVGILTEINMGLQAAIDRLAQTPAAFVTLLGTINELLRTSFEFINLSKRNHIEPWKLKAIYWILTGHSRGTVLSQIPPAAYVPGGNIRGWGSEKGGEFLKDVDEATIKEYFRIKRRAPATVMVTGIVVHSLHR